ncbi:MAG: hypothetical protein KDA97_12105, partial [Acidimicrobiales bacterium]|nr:hypothetical protein [Acidimicrobiales bacterium]
MHRSDGEPGVRAAVAAALLAAGLAVGGLALPAAAQDDAGDGAQDLREVAPEEVEGIDPVLDAVEVRGGAALDRAELALARAAAD